ncbi:hypothetical protein RD792_016655 [Penstemon davidsonii]|uniref:AB hydrolase-1 domain-containing protein n=1 Tax=Penstemon davidsonii TaxID=160366 RepID=A0ABR0CKX7_9LAMI|nr:hypothetical protein RD792_016655 [Penstemon davidsonii]
MMTESVVNPKHFVLVHGACHGAWSWYRVVPLLRAVGHRVTALDMAACGIHPKRVEEIDSFSDYCEPLIEFMEALPLDEKVVLVGHSMGGLCISIAMEMFPQKIAVAIFIAAFMPSPHVDVHAIFEESNKYQGSFMDSEFSFKEEGQDKQPTSIVFGSKFLSTTMYQLSPPEDLTLAFMLARPTRLYGDTDWLKGTILTTENYGSITRAYIVTEKDYEFQKWMTEINPADEVQIISGSDHMVMFSKPKELSYFLQEIAQNYYC